MGRDVIRAVVPIKRFTAAKSRLAAVLESGARRDFARLMAGKVLERLKACPEIDGILVVTADPSAMQLARSMGAEVCALERDEGVNAAVDAGFRQVRGGCDRVLILPSDLPLASSEDFERLLAEGSWPGGVTIVADKAGRGTNALVLPACAEVAFRFGENSAAAHAEAAREAGLDAGFVEIPGISLDIDTPEDLNALRHRDRAWDLALAGERRSA